MSYAMQISTAAPLQPPSISPQPAAFVNKLYRMISEATTNYLIHWSYRGDTFIVTKPEDFAREILPKYFKHNNFSSFVRQLNMYGFHKVPHLQQGVLLYEGEADTSWEFVHPCFQRDRPDLLCLVKRKVSPNLSGNDDSMSSSNYSSQYIPPNAPTANYLGHATTSTALTSNSISPILNTASPAAFPPDLKYVVSEMAQIKRQQEHIASQLSHIENEHSVLWHETLNLRERYLNQQEMIDKILRFLASVFTSDKLSAPINAGGLSEAQSFIEVIRKSQLPANFFHDDDDSNDESHREISTKSDHIDDQHITRKNNLDPFNPSFQVLASLIDPDHPSRKRKLLTMPGNHNSDRIGPIDPIHNTSPPSMNSRPSLTYSPYNIYQNPIIKSNGTPEPMRNAFSMPNVHDNEAISKLLQKDPMLYSPDHNNSLNLEDASLYTHSFSTPISFPNTSERLGNEYSYGGRTSDTPTSPCSPPKSVPGASSVDNSNNGTSQDAGPLDTSIKQVKNATEHLQHDIDALQLDLEELSHSLGLDQLINLSM